MTCENCGKKHDGSYGSGRYCSQKCARSFSTKSSRASINAKISQALVNHYSTCQFCKKPVNICGLTQHEKFCELNPSRDENLNVYRAKNKNINSEIQKQDKYIKLRDGSVLNCTYRQLMNYRDTHEVCEICGRTIDESIVYDGKFRAKQLCADHDHRTNQFRGLLCQVCNRQLGWFEKYKNQILDYLNKDYPKFE